jgi:hypothetical protein
MSAQTPAATDSHLQDQTSSLNVILTKVWPLCTSLSLLDEWSWQWLSMGGPRENTAEYVSYTNYEEIVGNI